MTVTPLAERPVRQAGNDGPDISQQSQQRLDVKRRLMALRRW